MVLSIESPILYWIDQTTRLSSLWYHVKQIYISFNNAIVISRAIEFLFHYKLELKIGEIKLKIHEMSILGYVIAIGVFWLCFVSPSFFFLLNFL